MSEQTVAQRAADALAELLIDRDWPSGRRLGPCARWVFRCRAAAIINGEAWAIRKTWPEAFDLVRSSS